MEVIDDLASGGGYPARRQREETILTIGAFDGVHRGHQALIAGVIERARATGRKAALMTFHPHPAVILAPARAPKYLTTPGEKIALLEALGLDLVVLLPFNHEVANMTARDFMERVGERLGLRELWVGADFALGRGREGDVKRLRELGQELGYRVHVVPPVVEGGVPISSSRIRSLIQQGAVAEAARLLGRYPSVSGEVVSGARRGRQLGFPTANLEVRDERAVPANGVYAVFALLGTTRYPAVANVGVRPSFDDGERTVETYLFDFDQDIYGCDLVVEFVARLRKERRFGAIDELIAQIERDSRQARQVLAAEGVDVSRDGGGMPCPFRYYEIDHTADRALQVWGKDLPDLFTGAARGMFSLTSSLQDGAPATRWYDIHLEALDRETLLVDWLNELLYLSEVEGVIFSDLRILWLNDTALQARAGGVPGHPTKAHIKAATFHDLALVEDELGWSTVITFDV
ncbi:MAG: bifunctional riboflavin kinase/FAD synthetase [Anaerolineae bacterium]|nr:bifunctional riboflavin kinase/FAD synthetase [Anaerolineae bacterium]